LANLAIGRLERRALEAIGSSHDGHNHASLGRVHVSRLVGLSQHPIDRRRKVVEPELHVKVGEAIVVPNAVAVHVALLLADGHHAQRDTHLLLDSHIHRVGGTDAFERNLRSSAQSQRLVPTILWKYGPINDSAYRPHGVHNKGTDCAWNLSRAGMQETLS
jgi:hypothetical protein